MRPTDPSELPPPPPFATSTDLDPSSEVDVDLEDDQGDEEQQLSEDTVEEEIEPLGEAESLEAFFRSQLEDLIDPCIHSLIFDCLDMAAIQEQFEAHGRYRYILEGRSIWRAGLPVKPSKDKDPSPGPWMPTRG